MKWTRNGPGSQRLLDEDGTVLATAGLMEYNRFWHVWMGDQEFPNGTRFWTLREAKIYAEDEVRKGRGRT